MRKILTKVVMVAAFVTAFTVCSQGEKIFADDVMPHFTMAPADHLVDSGVCNSQGTAGYDLYCSGKLIIKGDGEIESWAFSDYELNDRISDVQIEEGITSIGADAFTSCKNLYSISIPSSVTQIDAAGVYVDGEWYGECESPFWSCPKLSHIKVAENNPVYDSRYGCNALIRKADATVIATSEWTVLPPDIKAIGAGAFKERIDLKRITIPESVTEIKDNAFYGCDNLENVNFSANLEKIGIQAFCGCDSLESIKLPGSIKQIKRGAFENCYKLSSVKIADGLEDIGKLAFAFDYSLEQISIPSSVKAMAADAFEGSSCMVYIPEKEQADGFELTQTNYKIKEKIAYTAPVHWVSVSYGDFDNDKKITMSDVTTSLKIALGIESWNIPEEINISGNDKKIKLSDVARFLKEALKIQETQSSMMTCVLPSDYKTTNRGYKDEICSYEPSGADNADIIPDDIYENTYLSGETGASLYEVTDLEKLSVYDKLKIAEVYDVPYEKTGDYIYYKLKIKTYGPYNSDNMRISRTEKELNLDLGLTVNKDADEYGSRTIYFKVKDYNDKKFELITIK